MRTLTANTQAEIAAAQLRVVELYDFYLPATITTPAGSTNILRLGTGPKDRSFFAPDATWTNCIQSNSTHTTWRSFGLTCASGSNDHKFYVNGALVGTDTVTRGTMLKRFVIGGDANLSNAASDIQVNHILAFNAELTLAQIKALHNLLGYQYGLSAVS